MLSYKKEIIDPGDRLSKLGHQVCVASYGNSAMVEVKAWGKGFRGPATFIYNDYLIQEMVRGNVSILPQNDGAGHKPEFHSLLGDEQVFRGLGWEIIVMCLDDIVRWGGKGFMMMNQIDAKRITDQNFHLAAAALQGYGQALATVNMPNITGVTAAMKYAITAFCDDGTDEQFILTWNGACLGIVHEEKKLFPENIRWGLPIVGLVEHGTRCNGNSDSIAIVRKLYGEDNRQIRQNNEAVTFIRKLARPSQSYANLINRVHGYDDFGVAGSPLAKIVAIAHITGEGIWGKLGDLLPESIGAKIKLPYSPLLAEIQEKSFRVGLNFNDAHMMGVYHGGCGMMVICETEEDAQRLCTEAAKDGITANILGHTTISANSEILVESPYREQREVSSDEWRK